MSRKGKEPIKVVNGVKISIASSEVKVEGPKGKLSITLPSGIALQQKENEILVSRANNTKQSRANHGTVRSLVANMITGVSEGHKRNLEIQGLGFRAQLQGKKIVFNLGFSHPVEYVVPDVVKATVPDQTNIIIEGADNIMVGQVAAQIRALKPVEPYKGKGIRYAGEVVRRKQGKSVSK